MSLLEVLWGPLGPIDYLFMRLFNTCYTLSIFSCKKQSQGNSFIKKYHFEVFFQLFPVFLKTYRAPRGPQVIFSLNYCTHITPRPNSIGIRVWDSFYTAYKKFDFMLFDGLTQGLQGPPGAPKLFFSSYFGTQTTSRSYSIKKIGVGTILKQSET